SSRLRNEVRPGSGARGDRLGAAIYTERRSGRRLRIGDVQRRHRVRCGRLRPALRRLSGANRLMPYEFKLPDLGEGLTEGEIARWLVSEGQEIAEDDPLVEIQTDKTTVEIPSTAA